MQYNDGRHDFDFFLGKWHNANRRLKERLAGCTEWESFPGVTEARPILGGLGNIDDGVFERQSGIVHGMTLRLFDPGSREWRLYWADSVSGVLFTPMVGKFDNGIGRFYAQEANNNTTVFSRFIWSGITTSSCRWEQALSDDGGATWETNWKMDFNRIA